MKCTTYVNFYSQLRIYVTIFYRSYFTFDYNRLNFGFKFFQIIDIIFFSFPRSFFLAISFACMVSHRRYAAGAVTNLAEQLYYIL